MKRIPAPFGFPIFGWNEATIKAYCDEKPLQNGDHMIIYNGQSGLHQYLLATVVNASSGKQSRVIFPSLLRGVAYPFIELARTVSHQRGRARCCHPFQS